MIPEYHAHDIEKSLQAAWQSKQTYATSDHTDKKRFYCLAMLPYPSGDLHMGHVRNYTLGDVITRYQHKHQAHVLHPIGWDAFGLPAEKAAQQRSIAAKTWTYQNIESMRTQLKSLGLAYDWSREITTCSPSYYRWNQWLFLKMYERGLAYQKTSAVNWDPVDQTVLANEQVIDGKGWRSGAPVEQRQIKQWFFKITDYAKPLLDGLDTLSGWPEEVKRMQRHWIGESMGASISFTLEDNQALTVFTTRPDTLMGATYLAIAPQHPLAKKASEQNEAMAAFIQACEQTGTAEAVIATQEKKGLATGFHAIHPLTGKPLPIWVANYVMMAYGEGAVMAVPAHDERDFEFATRYQLPIQRVIDNEETLPALGHGTLIHAGEFNGLNSEAAKEAIVDKLLAQGQGARQRQYRLRDWGVSRQRYWGTPIPMIYCDQCGTVPVPEKDLPVCLPDQIDPEQGLKAIEDFYQTTCPQCQGPATRETDTLDTFVDSSWYYLRYTCPDQHDAMLDERAKSWTPVNQYIGGIEHATMHLLYARFIHRVLNDMDLVDSLEPFQHLLTQGMVLKDGFKMSKSKGNTVAPGPLLQQYGADTVRLFMMFAAPPAYPLEWQDGGIQGCYKYLQKLWQCTHRWAPLWQQDYPSELTDTMRQDRADIHHHLKQANHDYERQQYNTVVSTCMKMLNTIQRWPVEAAYTSLAYESLSILLRLLSPITPHITEQLGTLLGQDALSVWPTPDPAALQRDSLSLVVQINGKKKGDLSVSADDSEDVIEQKLRDHPSFQSILTGDIRRIIHVKNRLINVVIT